MKTGIVTLTDGDNFGNCLQNYALQTILKNYGDVETLVLPNDQVSLHYGSISLLKKLRPSYIGMYISNRLKDHYNIKNREHLLINSIIYYKKHKSLILSLEKKRKENFNKFRSSYLSVNEKTQDREFLLNVVNSFDAFVTGSDQVWNPVYKTTNSDMFLSFAKDKKRIAYAASFGVSYLPQEVKTIYRDWLSNLDYISVRENAGKKIINELSSQNVEVMPDPTILLKSVDWEKIMNKPKHFDANRKYILVYFLGRISKKYDRYIKRKAKEENLSIIRLYDIYDLNHYADGPSEFIYLIKNAEYVCTDSFHGTIFSVLFNKKFVVFTRQESGASMGSRLYQLFDDFGIEHNSFDYICNNSIQPSNCVDIESKLDTLRKSGEEYLEKALMT